jgi:hypothetical protein
LKNSQQPKVGLVQQVFGLSLLSVGAAAARAAARAPRTAEILVVVEEQAELMQLKQ